MSKGARRMFCGVRVDEIAVPLLKREAEVWLGMVDPVDLRWAIGCGARASCCVASKPELPDGTVSHRRQVLGWRMHRKVCCCEIDVCDGFSRL